MSILCLYDSFSKIKNLAHMQTIHIRNTELLLFLEPKSYLVCMFIELV